MVVRPDTLTVVEGDDPLPDVEVVVKRQVGGISGSVVDTSGRPVAGAILCPVPYWAGGRIHFTDDEGRFAIPRHEGDPDGPVQLQVDKLGYEVLLSGKHPADSKDVRLVLSPGIGFDLHVTRSDTGRPVEEYGIRLLSQPWQTMPDGSEHWITRGCPLLHRGRHDGGRLRVPAQRTGNYYLRVVPKDKTLHQPGLLRFTVAPDMTPLQVQVGLETQRLLRVVTRGGAPVEKTRVELLHRIFVKPVDLESSALEDMMSLGKSSAWLQQRGRTDAKGEVVLTGPASSRYALRALGPGHRPEVLNDVELAPDLGVLVVKVWAGAMLTGQAGPVAALKALTPDSKGALRLVNLNPGLYLVSHENRDVRWPVDSWESFPFGADGSFKITGIPPGTWELELSFKYVDGRGATYTPEPLGRTLVLQEGDVRELKLDLGHLHPGTVQGLVFVDGWACRNTQLHFTGTRKDATGGQKHAWALRGAQTHGQGRFTAQLLPGSYHVGVDVNDPAWANERRAWCGESILVAAGRDQTRTFQIQRRKLRVRVLDAAGKPVAKKTFEVEAPKPWYVDDVTTDADGWLTIDPAPDGAVQLSCAPKIKLPPVRVPAGMLKGAVTVKMPKQE